MHVKVIDIGNSRGIVLTKAMLKEAGIGEAKTLDLVIEHGSIILRPKKQEVQRVSSAGMIKATRPMPSLEEMKNIANEGWTERSAILNKETA